MTIHKVVIFMSTMKGPYICCALNTTKGVNDGHYFLCKKKKGLIYYCLP